MALQLLGAASCSPLGDSSLPRRGGRGCGGSDGQGGGRFGSADLFCRLEWPIAWLEVPPSVSHRPFLRSLTLPHEESAGGKAWVLGPKCDHFSWAKPTLHHKADEHQVAAAGGVARVELRAECPLPLLSQHSGAPS